jgi:hypothetical protein
VGVEIAIAQLTGAPRRYCLIGAAESDADKLRANTGFLRDNTSVKDLHARAPAVTGCAQERGPEGLSAVFLALSSEQMP